MMFLVAARFAKLQEAYDTLMDPQKRMRYDAWRHAGLALPFSTFESLHGDTEQHNHFVKFLFILNDYIF